MQARLLAATAAACIALTSCAAAAAPAVTPLAEVSVLDTAVGGPAAPQAPVTRTPGQPTTAPAAAVAASQPAAADAPPAGDAAPALPVAKIQRVTARAVALAGRARTAADRLAKTPIDQAKKARKKARTAANRLDRAVASLQRSDAQQVASALTSVTDAIATTKVRAKAARKWAKRIDRRLAKCPATARACVDLTYSMTWLQDGTTIIAGPVKMASGRAGLRTRPGLWTVYWKHKDHVSGYYGLPMPYAIFFDHVGIAFHQGSMHELSHGCVHLTWKSSKLYWEHLSTGDKVFVFGYAPYTAGQTTV